MPSARRTVAAALSGLALATALAVSGCAAPSPSSAAVPGSPSTTASASSSPSPSASPEPVVTIKKVTHRVNIPFEKVTRDDPDLEKGTKAVTTEGVKGIRTKVFRVTYTDGQETDRELISNEITRDPVDQVTSVGTYTPPAPEPEPEPEPASGCDPNYTGCVPIASDVDCAGGSGDGPAYSGPVQVIGSDVYGLDSDSDGYGCE